MKLSKRLVGSFTQTPKILAMVIDRLAVRPLCIFSGFTGFLLSCDIGQPVHEGVLRIKEESVQCARSQQNFQFQNAQCRGGLIVSQYSHSLLPITAPPFELSIANFNDFWFSLYVLELRAKFGEFWLTCSFELRRALNMQQLSLGLPN